MRIEVGRAMDRQANITQYFEKILASLTEVGEQAEFFSRLQSIAAEIKHLESFTRQSQQSLNQHIDEYRQQINLFSNLITFQDETLQFQSADQVQSAIFGYLNANMTFDHILICLEGDEHHFLTDSPDMKDLYQDFLHVNNGRSVLMEAARLIDQAEVLSMEEVSAPTAALSWDLLNAGSAILFPLKIRNDLWGFGLLTRQRPLFETTHSAFINLALNWISLLLYEHYREDAPSGGAVKHPDILADVKYADYFEKGPLYIYTLDRNGVILYANSSGVDDNPVIPNDAIGEKFTTFLPPDHRPGLEKILLDLQDGEFQSYQCPLVAQNGNVRVWKLFINCQPLKDNYSMKTVFALDTTTEYYQESLAVRNEIMDQVSQFSRVMTAYLNNLLTVMVPNVSLMKNRLPDTHELQKHLLPMEKALGQTGSLVKKFLNYNLADVDEQQRKIDLNKLIDGLVTRFQVKYPTNFEFRVDTDPEIPALAVFPKRITQLLKILLQNSLEALKGKADGVISFATRLVTVDKNNTLLHDQFVLSHGHYIELLVEDNGSGIAAAARPHVFKPFFSNKIKNEGLGLGLYVAYNIVKDMRGEIFLKSEVDAFTRFYIYLPVKMAEKSQSTELSPPLKNGHAKKAQAILVIDDEYSIRSVLQEVLEMQGFTVFSAANGREGVDLFQANSGQIDLVLLDMVMPEMDGKTAFKTIREIKPDQKFIIMSGYSKQEDILEISGNGNAPPFMGKPFQIKEILKEIQAILH